MNRTPWPLFLLAAACGSGGGGDATGCRSNAECGPGLVCVVPTSGQGGACQKPPLAVALRAPAPGARVGPGGVPVAAEVTLEAADAAPPTVVVVVNGGEAATLTPTGRSGGVVTYAGSYLPPAGAVFAPTLFVAAKTSAGLVPSDGVFVDVDTKPPALKLTSGPGCGALAACPRDGHLDVFIALTEDHPAAVEATVDLDQHAAAVPFGPAQFGSDLVASIPLGQYPFPRFSGVVTPRVHARDAFGNEATLEVPPFPVTRLRWAYDSKGLSVTSPAIAADGTAVVGVNTTSDQLRGIRASDGVELWRSTLGTKGIVSAPSIGASTIWVGSDDGKLYGRADANSIFGCPAGTAVVGSMFTPAVRLGTEAAFTGGASGTMYGATPDRSCSPSALSIAEPLISAPIAVDGALVVATANGVGAVTIRSVSFDFVTGTTASPKDGGTACSRTDVPLGYDGQRVIVACGNGYIFGTTLGTTSASTVAAFASAAPAGNVVVFPNGDLLVGTNDGKLHRLTPPTSGTGPWTDLWETLPALASSVRGVLVSQPDQDGVVAYATTGSGQLHALGQDGASKWSTAVDATAPLGISPLSFPTIAPADPARPDALPTLYVGSEDGHLYAVVVDAGLDPRSPWPKAHHDLRNTGNAAAPVSP